MKRCRKGANNAAIAAADPAIKAADRADANSSLNWHDVVEIGFDKYCQMLFGANVGYRLMLLKKSVSRDHEETLAR